MLLNDMHEDWDQSDNNVRPAIATLHTDGSGYWSSRAAEVRITGVKLFTYEAEDDEDAEDYNNFGELQIHFNTDDWRPDQHGLIYTDDLFKKELVDYFTSIGVDASDIGYSEQGMQGDNYVSLDAGGLFIASWRKYQVQVGAK